MQVQWLKSILPFTFFITRVNFVDKRATLMFDFNIDMHSFLTYNYMNHHDHQFIFCFIYYCKKYSIPLRKVEVVY